jgi:SAM-dependent methyltransferase
VIADLNDPLPYPNHSFDGAISHNVLECLNDPVALLDETARIMKPGGRTIWSHVDFDGIIIAGADRQLTRSVLHAYSDHPPTFLSTADGQVSRQIPGFVKRSRLELTGVSIHQTTSHSLTGDARARVEEIAGAVDLEAADLSSDDIATWMRQLLDADQGGKFFFSEPCVIVSSRTS